MLQDSLYLSRYSTAKIKKTASSPLKLNPDGKFQPHPATSRKTSRHDGNFSLNLLHIKKGASMMAKSKEFCNAICFI
jgi:hypothetical protein